MSEKLRWGILGTGAIARQFTADLLTLPDHAVVAVGSRNDETARAFADAHGIERAHGSYQALAEDVGVDVVYVATPHSGHRSAALACLNAGRGVLVEKPFAMNAAEATDIAAAARRVGTFCLEAMWTRFNPAIAKLRELLAEEAIGEIVSIQADFGFGAWFDPASRLFDPELGGGALLDLGVYPVSLASMVLGRPAVARAFAGKAPTGVDSNTGILLGYESGAVALLQCSLRAETPVRATIVGTGGRIELPTPFFRPDTLVLHRPGKEPIVDTFELLGAGYTYQAMEVARCIRAGLTESPLMPLDESIEIMHTLDALKASF